ncbi:MAG: hypothetical protein V3T05_04555 [Myxococcota bacterium]
MRAVNVGAVLSMFTLCVATLACDDENIRSSCPAGSVGCPCHDDGTCDAPLGCAADLCVVLPPFCGDGTINGAETCDDGYTDACGACNINCTGPGTGLGGCGDGEVCLEAGETCDDGFVDACGTCNADCTGAGTGPDCLDTERCSSVNDCILIDACRVDADCEVGDICSQLTACADVRTDATECMCILDGTCRVDLDCAQAEFCAIDPGYISGVCFPDGYCEDDNHCRPGHVCNTTTNACELDTNAQCTTNDLTAFGCVNEAVCCSTGVATDCCFQGERCAFTGSGDCAAGECVCIEVLECLDDPDCPIGFTCDLATDNCVPTSLNCTFDTECVIGTEFCSTAGTCIGLGTCAADADCASGEICNAMFTCEPGSNSCGMWLANAYSYRPNVLLVVDRSDSMGACEGSAADGCCGSLGCVGVGVPCSDDSLQCVDSSLTATRWTQTLQLIDELTVANTEICSGIRFGIDVYPRRCGSGGECTWPGACAGHVACGIECNSCTCDDTCPAGCAAFTDQTACTTAGLGCSWAGGACQEPDNYKAGVIDIAVGDNTRSEINQFLAATYPGGHTPIGPTLRDIWNDPSGAGLADNTRENAILLFAGSEADEDPSAPWDCTGVGCTCGTGNSGPEVACKTNFVLDGLRSLSPIIKTYVIGFGGVTPSPTLNCYAVHGGTSTCQTPAECQIHTTVQQCHGPPGCTWNGFSCDGSGCQVYVTQQECQGPPGCTWNGSSCDGVDETTCASTSATCYHDGYDSAAVLQAFRGVVSSCMFCSWTIGVKPPPASALRVYMRYDNAVDMPAGCSNPTLQICRLEEGATTYLHDVSGSRVDFYGTSCDELTTGKATPAILWECFPDGG